jgi:hypothetical protein
MSFINWTIEHTEWKTSSNKVRKFIDTMVEKFNNKKVLKFYIIFQIKGYFCVSLDDG